MSKICIIIFFFAFAGVAFAHGKASKRQPLPDSTKIYEQLIEMEDEDAHYGRNIAGILPCFPQQYHLRTKRMWRRKPFRNRLGA